MPMSRFYQYQRQQNPFLPMQPPMPFGQNPSWDQLMSMGPWARNNVAYQTGNKNYTMQNSMLRGMQGNQASEGQPNGPLTGIPNNMNGGEASLQPQPYVPGSPSFQAQGGGNPVNPQLMGMATQALSPMFQMGLSPDVLFNTLLSALQHQYGGGTGGF